MIQYLYLQIGKENNLVKEVGKYGFYICCEDVRWFLIVNKKKKKEKKEKNIIFMVKIYYDG